jgi:two-component system sensor histidine kinase AlgZ
MYLIVWGAAGLLAGFILSFYNNSGSLLSFAVTVPMFVLYGEVNLSAWYLARAFPMVRTPVWTILLVTGIAVTLVSGVWTFFGWGVLTLLERFGGAPLTAMPMPQLLSIVFVTGLPFFLISMAVSYLIAAFERTKESEHNAYEARLLAQNAELKALRMQIDPHFLFNSLNSISALTASDPRMARTMTTMLADFFRKSLSYGAKESIPLREELSLLNDYLAIERIRFGDRLTVRITAMPGADDASVPPLILQPLAENAIKHGIADSLNGGIISVTAQLKNGRLFIAVENPVEDDAPKKKGAGMGMEIVRQRLQTLYGNNGDLKTGITDGVFQAVLFLPLERQS